MNNSGCNSKEVRETYMVYRKDYKSLADDLTTWLKDGEVNNPSYCSQLYFSN